MGSIPTRSRHLLLRPVLRRAVAVAAVLAALGSLPGVGGLRAQEADETADDTADAVVVESRGAAAAPEDSARGGPPLSPLGAFARSLVIPGWGQAEVGRPGRGAFYFVAQSATLFMALRAQFKLDAAEEGFPADSGLVEARKGQRENWFALAGFWALLSGVDAWVSTHFWEFEGKLQPPEDGSEGVELRYEVPLGGG